MTITPSIFEAFLKCPMKSWLRATNEQTAGNLYAEWVKAQNESYRVAETNRLVAQLPPPGSTLSPPAETLKLAKWLLASDVVVRATGISRGSRSEKAPSSPSRPSQPGIDVGSGGLGNRTPAPSSALRMPDSTLETSPAHLGAAPQPAESPPTCVLETCLHMVERVPAGGRGKAAQFIPIRCIFFNKLTKDHRLLLAYDALVLGQVLGRDVAVGKIIHGDDHATLKVKTSALAGEVRKCLEKIAALLSGPAPSDLVLNRHCAECEFEARCRQIAIEKDDLSLLGGMSAKERQKLRSKGIFTVTQLSYTFRPRRRPRRLRDKREKYHHSVKALAIREKKIHIVGSPELKIEGTPVYLDVEGLPDRDFYYLIGVRIGNGDSAVQHSLWADTIEDEGRIWQAFLALLETVENPVLIHYGRYEATFLKHMSTRYGNPSGNSTAATAIGSTVNLLTTIYAQMYFPTYSNGLKELAGWLGFRWCVANASGLQAILWRQQWQAKGGTNTKVAITTYNAEDCQALEVVTRVVSDPSHKAEAWLATAGNGGPAVHTELLARETIWPRFASPISELNEVNKAARWDYQRERIYARSSALLRRARAQRESKETWHNLRPTRTILSPEEPYCPICLQKGTDTEFCGKRVLHDLCFGRTGVRRRIVEYRYPCFRCPTCGLRYGFPKEFWPGRRFGRNLVAYLLYHVIELNIPMRTVRTSINRFFGLNLRPNMVAQLKTAAATNYEDTSRRILDRLTSGKVLHVDETRVSIKGKTGYVWVFANPQGVAFLYHDTREGDFVHQILRHFHGVLVSDFFAAYEAVACPQQKCLLHLIRDLNSDVLEYPYDEVLKGIVKRFGLLLKRTVETVDHFGLKSYHLKKHIKLVHRFYHELDCMEMQSEVANKCRQRFLKYRHTLFTFLSYDGVPWNNNNAEHAVKALAALRDLMQGSWTAKSVQQDLVLLSVSQTCKYMGVDFLDFLCSGEKDIHAFAESKRRRPRKPLEYPPTLGAAPLGLDGSYWLDLFTGTTWMEFRAAGARITGFRPRMRNSVARIKKGDILLCYLTGAMRWVGALQVVGHSTDRRPIWTESDFPERLEVKPLIVLEPERGVPMSELAEKAPCYRNVASFKKFKGFLRGSPKRFKNRRNGEIILRMLYAVQRTPVSRAVGSEEPGKN